LAIEEKREGEKGPAKEERETHVSESAEVGGDCKRKKE
jgi:hypothetical protein